MSRLLDEAAQHLTDRKACTEAKAAFVRAVSAPS
jgi:hypothetical protein